MPPNDYCPEDLGARLQRAENYLEALLATAMAFIEANLTSGELVAQADGRRVRLRADVPELPPTDEVHDYDSLQEWICDNIVCEEHARYLRQSSRTHLLDVFEQGERRASVSFSACLEDGGPRLCRELFHLYQDAESGDVYTLCIIYDLTQQQRREKETEALRRELMLSRIRNSTSQMKPHFLYNALGSIQEVVLSDPDYAAQLIEDFTVHLRSCIRAMDNDRPIPFAQELENVRAYANIEKMRLGEKLHIEYDLKAQDFSVLPLTIQPLVENAIRHGIYQKGPQGGTVTVMTFPGEHDWVIQVIDDGVGFDVMGYEHDVAFGKTDSAGLKNIRFRLEKILGARLDIRSRPGTGTTVTVRIPKEVAHDARDNRR